MLSHHPEAHVLVLSSTVYVLLLLVHCDFLSASPGLCLFHLVHSCRGHLCTSLYVSHTTGGRQINRVHANTVLWLSSLMRSTKGGCSSITTKYHLYLIIITGPRTCYLGNRHTSITASRHQLPLLKLQSAWRCWHHTGQNYAAAPVTVNPGGSFGSSDWKWNLFLTRCPNTTESNIAALRAGRCSDTLLSVTHFSVCH